MADSAIRVAVRSRPLIKEEKPPKTGGLEIQDNVTVVMQDKCYKFDYVFRPDDSNETVYNMCIAKNINCILEGYNVTVLAYGPTGSGKTYTMGTNYKYESCPTSDVGIIPRSVREIFRLVDEKKESIDFTLKVSFLEVYREDICDLLQKSVAPCNLREDADGIKVVNLTEIVVSSESDAFRALEKGCNSRRTSATAKNVGSSRSHAIFSIYIEQRGKGNDMTFRRSKFQLVDLAGSERMNSSKTVGVHTKEGININLGLLSLGKVILHLVEEKPHIPYRDSKLTRLLQDSLGGNSHTVMIACLNPSSSSVDETVSTLRYATGARKIKNRPVVNTDPPEVQVEKLKKQVQALQSALINAKGHLQDSSERSEIIGDQNRTFIKAKCDEDYKKLHLDLQSSFQAISALNKKLTEAEDKHNQIIEKIQCLNEEIKLYVVELIAAASTNPDLQDQLQKFEKIKMQSQLLTFDITTTFEEKSLSEEEESHDVSEQSALLQESELQKLENLAERQKCTNRELENVKRTLSMKEETFRSLQALKNCDTNIDEAYIDHLIDKIQALSKEKSDLEEKLLQADKKYSKENQEKVSTYEKTIENLKAELKTKKSTLQYKELNNSKMDSLQAEIKDLKKYRVTLIKQMKEEGTRFSRLQREKDRQVAQLIRETRKNEYVYMQMKTKLSNQVTVLKQKVDQATNSKKRLAQAFKLKRAGPGDSKTAGVLSRATTEDLLEKNLDAHITKSVAKFHFEMVQKQAEQVKQRIKELQEPDQDPCTGSSETSEKIVLQAELQVLLDKMTEMDNIIKDETEKVCDVVDHINTMANAKFGLAYLFKKSIAAGIEIEKQKCNSLDLESNNNALLSKLNTVQEEFKQLKVQTDFYKEEQEHKYSVLKFENKTLKLQSDINSFSTGAHFTVDPNLDEETNAKQIKEVLDRESIRLKNEYDRKRKEVDMLKRQVYQSKMGNKKWLADLTQQPSSSVSSAEGNRSASMLEEYLSDVDSPSSHDENDPDWRATPLYKQLKQKRMLTKATMKEKHDSESMDIDSPPRKKLLLGCNCRSKCKTNHCSCKKQQSTCDAKNCGCDQDLCENMAVNPISLSFNA